MANIVFLPGFSGLPPRTYNPLLHSLAQDHNVVSIKYKIFGFGDMRLTANRVEHVLEDNFSGQSVCLVGHSMGGLVARCVDPGLYDSFVTLGSPHNGVQRAFRGLYDLRTFPIRSVQQMSPDSDFVKNLPLRAEKPQLHISGEWDLIVPPGSIKLETKKAPRATHLGLLTSSYVLEEIKKFLS